MKKFMALLLSVVMAFSLTACCNINVLDMLNKNNRLCAENIDYIKDVDIEATITVCSAEDQYIEYMNYFAQNYYNIMTSTQEEYDALYEYFAMTQKMLSQYEKYNRKINVEYVDPQSVEFVEITSKSSDYELTYGDMLVTATVNGKERVKVLKFEDIYILSENTDNTYYAAYSIIGNKLESSLTSAIACVTSTDSKKVAILSGHSNNSYTEAYQELLEKNNYEVIDSDARIIKSISNDYDAIVIAAPTMDFTSDEIKAISEFLDNDGKLGKGLIFFADAAGPYLPNLYAFLKEWGISISEGIVFETDSNNRFGTVPTTIAILPAILGDDDITSGMSFAIADYNAPMKVYNASYERKATAFMQTTESTVIAPIGSGKEWMNYTDGDKTQFDCVIQSVESDYDKDNNEITSYVMAFSSIEFYQSAWASYAELDNQAIVMACTDRACHMGDFEIKFTAKVVEE